MSVPGLAAYPDLLAFALTMVLTFVCALGARESTNVNNLLTVINLVVIFFVIIAGMVYGHIGNLTPFAPAGFNGVFGGAATAFFAYVGFDVIATSAEEAKDPSRTVPLGIVGSLGICSILYLLISGVFATMLPFPYDGVDLSAPLASAFQIRGANWASYIISVGAVCGLTTSLMTSIFPMPRIVYAIATDGLLPAWAGRVSPRFGTPVAATLLCGLLAAAMAMLFDITELADMMSIGTLMSYTLVSASVLMLRFREADAAGDTRRSAAATPSTTGPSRVKLQPGAPPSLVQAQLRGRGASDSAPLLGSEEQPTTPAASTSRGEVIASRTRASTSLAARCVSAIVCGALAVDEGDGGTRVCGRRSTIYRASVVALLTYCGGLAVACASAVVLSSSTIQLPMAASAPVATLAVVALGIALLAAAVVIVLPSSPPRGVSFVTPAFPYVPLMSVAVNFYLLANLSYPTWIRFVVWCILGTAIYLGYGVGHSVVGRQLAAARVEADKAAVSENKGVHGYVSPVADE